MPDIRYENLDDRVCFLRQRENLHECGDTYENKCLFFYYLEGGNMKEIVEKNEFIKTIDSIKQDVINTRNKIMYNANRELINMYFRMGKNISENVKYGNNFISILSKSLKLEFTNSTGFSERNLRRMKAFYEQYKVFSNLPPAVADLPWTHNYILLEKVKDIEKRIWYAEECLKNGWSKNVLVHQIELELYERKKLSNKFTNFNQNIELKNNSDLANEIIKDPYIFELEGLRKNYVEKELEEHMITKIRDVLLELGKGFCFIGNQYKISTNSQDYYIDMLFYHLDLRCYIVVELKASEFKPEYIGQLGFYVTAVDKTLKKEQDNQTIGLLLCKEKDKLSVEWALDFINVPIGVASYNVINKVKKDILDKLPTEQDINMYINMNNE